MIHVKKSFSRIFMKYILPLFIMTLPQLSLAGLSECGEYEVRGVVRAKQTSYEIVVNEKTQSEINIALPMNEQLKLLPYSKKPMTAVLVLDKTFDGTNGTSDKVISIKDRIPEPLKPDDTGVLLLKKMKCKN